jgi:hypothetical protein
MLFGVIGTIQKSSGPLKAAWIIDTKFPNQFIHAEEQNEKIPLEQWQL